MKAVICTAYVPPSFWLPARLMLGLKRPRQQILGGELAEKGILKPVMDRRYNFEEKETMEAHTYGEQGHKKGNVVISIKRK